MAGEKIKISQMATANIAADDLIPFVKVPGNNGAKTNQKTTADQLKAFVLNGFNPGGNSNISLQNLVFLNSLDNPFISDVVYVNDIVTNTPVLGQGVPTATYIETDGKTKCLFVEIPILFNTIINPLIFLDIYLGHAQFADSIATVKLLANGIEIGAMKHTADYFKSHDDFYVKSFEEYKGTIGGNIIVNPFETIVFEIKFEVNRFFYRGPLPNGINNKLAFSVANLTPHDFVNNINTYNTIIITL
jgi:hypothetical protein